MGKKLTFQHPYNSLLGRKKILYYFSLLLICNVAKCILIWALPAVRLLYDPTCYYCMYSKLACLLKFLSGLLGYEPGLKKLDLIHQKDNYRSLLKCTFYTFVKLH